MPERPLLLFPQPEVASRSTLSGRDGGPRLPSHQRQGVRLAPKFNQLQAAFEARRIEIQRTTAGVDPEQVIVIETVGSVEDFANAATRIEGLEWMGEIDIDELAPDQDFHDESNPNKELSGRLYLVMTNQRALNEMLSLWRRYQADPNMKFDRGFTRFRDVFLRLKDLRRWDVQDRLLETGIIDVWREDLEHDGDRLIRFEVELWFRGSLQKRQDSQTHVTGLIEQLGGRILRGFTLEDIAYHALLAELPANSIRPIVQDPTTELVKCDNIMFFRPVGQISVGEHEAEGDVEIGTFENIPAPAGEPVIALLDGLPLANHHLLAGRLIIDDPDSWEADYAAFERVHGTAMASLIVQGDLNDGQKPLPHPLFVRPIMKPMANDFIRPRREHVPDDIIAVDLIHRAVRRMFEGEAGEKPVAPTVRIINLSIGDPSRQFTHTMSPWARLIDWLSAKYNVLFVISAGNHSTKICLDVTRAEFDALQPPEREKITIKAMYQDARHRKILSPAESINALTVGAVHADTSQVAHAGNRFDPFEQVLPSPISAFGTGYRRAVKPDLVFCGGRQWYRLPLQPADPIKIEPAIFKSAPGNMVASPGNLPGELSATSYCCGTSNAAALISRAAGICHESLQQTLGEQAPDVDADAAIVPLLKAMVVHGCSWGDTGNRIAEILRTPGNGPQINSWVGRWLGYGIARIERILDCTEQRATLFGFGQLSDSEAHLFRLPLPPSLASRREWRRLTVTLSWLSPIRASTQRYRTASMWFELTGTKLAYDRKELCGGQDGWRAVRRGTVQHEVFEGQRAEPFIDGDLIEIKVNCREDAGKIATPIPYGIVVSLEVADGVNVAIYDEIRTRIAPVIQIQQGIIGDSQ